MEIAYVSLHWPRKKSSGVGKKIIRQINSWRESGHEVQLFMHSISEEVGTENIPGELFYFEKSKDLRKEWGRIRAAIRLIHAVDAYKPDVIYIRYGMYVYPIHRLAAIAPLIEELNTNDISQHKRLGKIFYLYNRMTRGILIKRTSGLVYLSNELANFPFNSMFKKISCVIGDGIDLKSVTPLPAPNNPHPRIAFIGTPDSPWQGVEKLAQLAILQPDICVHIIGYDQIYVNEKLPDNLHLHGYLESQEYRKILSTMDCAIGSIGLHRINLNESSPLKTRECLALGLPMILPYKDTDLDSLNCDFLLQIPNTEDNIRTYSKNIRDFAYKMRGKRVVRKLISSIDQYYKEQARLKFFEAILSGGEK